MEIIELKKHDIVLVRLPGELPEEVGERMHAALRSVLPEHVLSLVVPEEYDVSILRPYE